ncbi:MAG: phosphoribosyltransferase [Actinobacteria bacterium]|nr:phosphoribosyltransferase [Actinomycetota bacterium]
MPDAWVDAVAVFKDRHDAGRRLARHLHRFAALQPIVVGMPRGGVPVAAEVAGHLSAPLDIVVVRKIGCPWQPELGIGAIAEGDVRVLNDVLIREIGVRPDQLEATTATEAVELARRVRRYRGDRAAFPVEGRTVILVDDGLATGYTARAAIETLRQAGARRVILAVPVAPQDSATALRNVADEVVVVETPPRFFGVGQAYREFAQTSDDEVVAILERAAEGAARPAP